MRLLIFILLLPFFCQAQQAGKVVAVYDGDTITILDTSNNSQIKVRLRSIDCPEKRGGQAFGERAKQFTSEHCFGKYVQLVDTDKDRYGRTLATVILPSGDTLNNLILAAGMAWHYKKYDQSARLAELENTARALKLGLWKDSDPTPPWLYRKK